MTRLTARDSYSEENGMSGVIRQGGCRCGKVRYEVRGEPEKVGLCHCADCRKETGSAFLAYAGWSRDAFSSTGAYRTYEGRSFCPECGTRLFHLSEARAGICIGSLDARPVIFHRAVKAGSRGGSRGFTQYPASVSTARTRRYNPR